MMMLFIRLSIFWLFFLNIFSLHAREVQDIQRKDAFIFFASMYATQVPESFKYIDLKYRDVPKDSELEDALQILVYLNLIPNKDINIVPRSKVSIHTFEALWEKILGVGVSKQHDSLNKKAIYTTYSDLEAVYSIVQKRNTQKDWNTATESSSNIWDLWVKWQILEDVYTTLQKSHYNKSELDPDELLDGAIKGLTESVWDGYTTYFPPVESQDFFEWLEWEYEWIGAYVDMPSPGKMIIVSPIVGSPAEASWLKGGDIITHVDAVEITSENSLKEVITWIKWPAGSIVTLTIERERESSPMDIKVTREKITLKDIEYKKLNSTTYYIQMKNFWDNADKQFKEALEDIKSNRWIKKIIFDLRNNPGWYLWEVSSILSYAVEKWEPTAIVSNGERDLPYVSLGFDLIDFSEYELVFLQNWGTASASEIMVGTMKDYYPNATIIWEQSFGKGSVQSLKSYRDGSTLKYTTAKWYTGKSKNGIDGIGVTPDILIEFDADLWEMDRTDNQLDEALKQ